MALAIVMTVLGCGGAGGAAKAEKGSPGPATQPSAPRAKSISERPAGFQARAPLSEHPGMATFPDPRPNEAVAIFAGGCFWCMEKPFEETKGVNTVLSGYTGGHVDDPTYEMSNTHTTGHVEAIWIAYDTTKVSYDKLLDIYWRNVDPTTEDRQFCDRGDTYVSAIFALDARQRAQAEASRIRAAARLKVAEPIVTPIRDAVAFWPAEVYHQDYYRKNPVEYQSYRLGCRRDARLRELWGDAAKH